MNITDTTHTILLHLLDQLTGVEADALRDELAATHNSYMAQLAAVQFTGGTYELLAAKVRAKASVKQRELRLRLRDEN